MGLGLVLPFDVGLDLEGSYINRVYRHPSTFPEQEVLDFTTATNRQYFLSGTRRREDVYTAEARATLPVTDSVAAVASYRYRDHRSTADVFDYDQHVVGLIFTITFGRDR